MKTSVKYFGLVVGPSARQYELKWAKNYFTNDDTHKKYANLKKKFSSAD